MNIVAPLPEPFGVTSTPRGDRDTTEAFIRRAAEDALRQGAGTPATGAQDGRWRSLLRRRWPFATRG